MHYKKENTYVMWLNSTLFVSFQHKMP